MAANWDDLRFVLAVAEEGTVSGAARQLGVNHATVLRRIDAFESRAGARLFERTARGYVIPPERLRVLQAARDVEAAFGALDDLMRGGRAELRGVVRITSTDSLCLTVLPQILARLHGQAGDLRCELHTSNVHVDFSRLHAHITVRPAHVLPDDLTGDIGAALEFGIYGVKPEGPWLTTAGVIGRSIAGQWMRDNVASGDVIGSADSFPALAAMTAAMGARTILPSILGDRSPGLTRLDKAPIGLAVPLWVASPGELAETGRLRLARAALLEGLENARKALAPTMA